jgi:hypothetical protein
MKHVGSIEQTGGGKYLWKRPLNRTNSKEKEQIFYFIKGKSDIK